ncbi:MAG: archaetidylserine decarboxylase [bacterium]
MPTFYFLLFRWFPKRLFSRLIGIFAVTPWPRWLLGAGIRLYAGWFRIDLSDFEAPSGGFRTFNAFFTRGLKPGARPIDASGSPLVSPVDGTVLSLQRVAGGKLIQAKGKEYSLSELLGGVEGWEKFDGGQALTVYLSPRDYHRIHSPCRGTIRRFAYVPGDLWTVGALGVRGVPRLFSRNERVAAFLEAPLGEVAMVAVGATVVGGIRLVYHPLITNRFGAAAFTHTLEPGLEVEAGDEVGRFQVGSTVILLTRPGEIGMAALRAGDPVRMGQTIGHFTRTAGTD